VSIKNLVTQGEIGSLTDSLGALADNLNAHVNDSLSNAHGFSMELSPYLDTGGNYHTDFGASTPQVIPGLYNTGVNNDGSLATVGTAEQHWQLVQVPYSGNSGAYIETPIYSGNSQLSSKSQWIGPNINGNAIAPNGSYRFRLTFSLAGLNPSTAVINVNFSGVSVQGSSTIVYLNGVATGIAYSPLPNQFSIKFKLTTGFIAGTNTLDFLMGNNGYPVGLVVELSGTAFIGGPAPIPTLFNTGLTAGGGLAAPFAVDPNWTIISSADSSAPGPNAIVVNDAGNVYPFGQQSQVWAPNGPRSKWIGPKGNQSALPPAQPNTMAVGNYTYRLSFSLAGFNPATAIVRGVWASDNTTTAVLLNGQATGITGPSNFASQPNAPFLLTSGFVAGVNTLDFVVNNNALGPSGIRVEVSGTAQLSGTGQPGRVLRLTIGSTELFIPAQLSGGIDGTPDATIPTVSGAATLQSADPASNLLVGSPTNCALVTTFAAQVAAITNSSNAQLFNHAGDIPENVHGGASWQPDTIFSSGGYLVGRRSINIVVNGAVYKLVADTNLRGPGG
jgi:hypothetical protein